MTPAAVRLAAPPGPDPAAASAWAPAGAPGGQAPLTHHEILALVEPFVRSGIAPDLAGSDRAARRVAFRPRAVEPDELQAGGAAAWLRGALPPLTETWQLDSPEPGHVRLMRQLATPQGLAAQLHAEGPDAQALLRAAQAVPVQEHFRVVAGVVAALTLRLPEGAQRPVLRHARAQVGAVELHMKVSGVGGYPAELELLRTDAAAPRLPHDLLAVLGRAWDHLGEVGRGWMSRVSLRGEEPRRSREALARLDEALAHLARTFAEPPARFHARHRLARWGVALRSTLPWAGGAAIVGGALLVRREGGHAVLALLANAAPPLLMILLFVRREMPRIGIPRLPRRLDAQAWVPAPAPAAPSAGAPAAAPDSPAAPAAPPAP